MKQNYSLHKLGTKFRDADSIIKVIGIRITNDNIIYELKDNEENVYYLSECRLGIMEEIKLK